MRMPYLKEINVIKKSIHDIKWRIGIVYPNSYSVGMSGLSVKLLYHLMNQHQNIFAERIFFSPNSPELVRSIETRRFLNQFDILAFTFQFELDYVNAIRMLQDSKIPILSKDRSEKHPLIIAGGPTIIANPKPIIDIFDVIFIGDFETVSYSFLEAIIAGKIRNLADLILELPGFYNPQESSKNWVPILTQNLDEVNYPIAQVRPTTGRLHRKGALDGYFLQLSRGCSHGCHFCLIGKIFRPYRERSLLIVKKLIEDGKKYTQTDFFSLIGSSTAEYSQLKELFQYFIEKNIKFTLPSLRADSGIELLKLMDQSGQKSLTIAPECGSESVRHKIGKKISNSQIQDFVQSAEANNIQQLKLYFILGLTSDPVQESNDIIILINDLIGLISSIKINVSVNPLVPKCGTILGGSCINYHQVESGFSVLKQKLRKNVKYKLFPTQWAAIQAILSIGGRELTSTLINVAKQGGSLSKWKQVLNRDPIDYYLNFYCR
jgi:radical SAM superfamily enzyme YgiQ (UPF0313 family)